MKIISMHLSHAPPRIRDVNPTVDVPPPLEQAMLQALEKSRENRFATASAFLQALDDARGASRPSARLRRRRDRCSQPARARGRRALRRAGRAARRAGWRRRRAGAPS